MAETKHIGAIAEIISSHIFNEMKWLKGDETDVNWKCCMDSHLTKAQREAKEPKGKTHPTDIVFSYPDPYDSEVTIYVQTDLKSYKKSTIENYQGIRSTIMSLAQQVECSQKSPEWRGKYLLKQPSSKYKVHGMLFIYNHDNEYDDELFDKLSGVPNSEYSMPENSMMAVFDPRLIRFLLSTVEEINKRRNIPVDATAQEILWQKIPERNKCSFFYPDKHNKLSVKGGGSSASLEMITSGMLMFSYEHDFFKRVEDDKVITDRKKILNIFWDEDVKSKEAFVFFLEYVFNYQLLNQFDRIYISTPFSSTSGYYLKDEITYYARNYSFNSQQLKTVRENIISIPIHTITVSIYDFQVGSEQHNRTCNFE